MDYQTIEYEEQMTVPLSSVERGNAPTNLVVDVRITWTPYEGIFAEALGYSFAGRPHVRMGSSLTSGLMDEFVRRCVAENYDERCLDHMLADDPAFIGAARYEFAENEADRGWTQARAI